MSSDKSLSNSSPAEPAEDPVRAGEEATEPVGESAPQDHDLPTEPVAEDDPVARDTPEGTLTGEDQDVSDSPRSTSAKAVTDAGEREDAGDADSIPDEALEEDAGGDPDWDSENSTRRIAVELKRIERDLRQMLDGRDNKRKRRLTGTRRWLDLHEDLIFWKFSSRLDAESEAKMELLIARRQYLFTRLQFLAVTRTGWNS